MVKQLKSLFSATPKNPSLYELDAIYKMAISKLPISAQKEYCERLISRTAFEIKHTTCKYEIEELEQLSRAAITEISNMEP